MARRVGFGNGGKKRPAPREPNPAELSRPLDVRFRPPVPRAIYKGQFRPVVWVVLAFLGFWLVGWTIGIVVVVVQLLAQPDADPFLYVWLGFAAIGWTFGVWVLINIVRGLRSLPEKPE